MRGDICLRTGDCTDLEKKPTPVRGDIDHKKNLRRGSSRSQFCRGPNGGLPRAGGNTKGNMESILGESEKKD